MSLFTNSLAQGVSRAAPDPLRNAGPGVAHIQSVMYYIDGMPIDDISQMLDEAGFDADRDTGVDLDRGDAIAPDDVVWIINYSPRSRAEEPRARELFEKRMQVAVEYCDANDVCKRICSAANGCPVSSSTPHAEPRRI